MLNLTLNIPFFGPLHLGVSFSPLRTKEQLDQALGSLASRCAAERDEIQERLDDTAARFVLLQKQAKAADRRRQRYDAEKAKSAAPSEEEMAAMAPASEAQG